MNKKNEKTRDYLIAFILPVLIMSLVFILRGVYPFGDETLLTVDLGQQYIDFYRDYKRTLLENPQALFYSFSKALGGEMTGVWSYYLTSPLNLIFLLFPSYHIDSAVTVLTLLKYGLSGLFMAVYLKETFRGRGARLVIFSSSYALMGYQVIYQMNPMWIDGVFLLPLLALGVEKILSQQKMGFFIFILGLAIFSNYYIGYMLVIFISLYFLYRLTFYYIDGTYKGWTASFRRYAAHSLAKFALGGILGAGLGAVLHIPTVLSLLSSKGTYAESVWDFSPAYPAQELLSKFVLGGFDFDQLPDGLPNVFVGSFVLILFVSYFFNKNFDWRGKVATFILTLFLLLSLNIPALNKIWHIFQYPVWFPYRFSFVLGFLMIVVAFRSSQKMRGMSFGQTIASLLVGGLGLWYVYDQNFSYVEDRHIFLTLLFFAILCLTLYEEIYLKKWSYVLLSLMTLTELGLNAAISQDEIPYVNHQDFQYAQALLDEGVQPILAQDSSFYRLEKNFHRSKNDAHQAGYQGATLFSSTLERSVAEFYQTLGLPGGSGYAVYSNGTLFTDAFFGIKYYINEWQGTRFPAGESVSRIMGWTPRHELVSQGIIPENPVERPEDFGVYIVQSKPDLKNYPLLDETPGGLDIRYNPYHLNLGLVVDEDMFQVNTQSHPFQVQNQIFHALNQETDLDRPLLSHHPVQISTKNLRPSINVEDEAVMYVMDEDQEATMTLNFTAEGEDSYYLYINGRVNTDDLNYRLNDQGFYSYQTYQDGIFLNLGGNEGGRDQEFTIQVTGSELNVSDFELFRLDQDLFEEEIKRAQAKDMTITDYDETFIKGEVTIQDDEEILALTLPYSDGWSATANGEKVELVPLFDTLMALDLEPGTYDLEFRFRTPGLYIGGFISLLSALITVYILYREAH